MKIISAFMATLFLSGSVLAADCSTVEEMDTADTVASKIQDWTDVNSFYSHFRQCDDGYISEGMSATVVNLLAHKWGDTAQLEKITDKDKNFESWILNHIDTTVNSNDLGLIIKNAKNECPAGSDKFCKKIESAASQALQEMAEPAP